MRAPMDAVAADPAFRPAAGHDQPQPLPRTDQRFRAICEIEIAIAQPGRLPRIAEGDEQLPVTSAAELDAIQRLAFGAEQCYPGSRGGVVHLENDFVQARPRRGNAGKGQFLGVLRRKLDATVVQFAETCARRAGSPSKSSCAGGLPSSTTRDGQARFPPGPDRSGPEPGLAALHRATLRGKRPLLGRPAERSSGARHRWSRRQRRSGNGFDRRPADQPFAATIVGGHERTECPSCLPACAWPLPGSWLMR